MTLSQVKYSGGKVVPRSDFRVGTTGEERSVKNWRRITTWNVRTMLRCGKGKSGELLQTNLRIEYKRRRRFE